MKLSTSSKSIQFYSWFYGVDEYSLIKQKNFCPIFWKLVIAYLFAIPYIIFCLPVILMEIFGKNYENGDHSTGSRIGMSFFIYVAIFIAFSMILGASLIFFKYNKDSFLQKCATGGVLFWVFAFGVGTGELIKYIKKKRIKYDEDGYRIYEEKKPNLLVTGIKSWYEKNCPRIEWADLKNTNQN
jgi:hypothetical protein